MKWVSQTCCCQALELKLQSRAAFEYHETPASRSGLKALMSFKAGMCSEVATIP